MNPSFQGFIARFKPLVTPPHTIRGARIVLKHGLLQWLRGWRGAKETYKRFTDLVQVGE
jgi:hypothetical protein